MNGWGLLKDCFHRWHRKLGMSFALLALFTCFLQYNYLVLQRDLFYWKGLFLMLLHKPLLVIFFMATLVLPLIAFLRVHQHLTVKLQIYISQLISKYHRRKYAEFIMRRLLLQLELAMLGLPKSLNAVQLDDPVTRERYQLAKDAAYRAVDIFRRDASKLLVKTPTNTFEQTDIFVLREEELLLLHGGYSQIGMNVNKQVLSQLLHLPAQSNEAA